MSVKFTVGLEPNKTAQETKQNTPRGGSLPGSQAGALATLPAQKLFCEKADLNKCLGHIYNCLTDTEILLGKTLTKPSKSECWFGLHPAEEGRAGPEQLRRRTSLASCWVSAGH